MDKQNNPNYVIASRAFHSAWGLGKGAAIAQHTRRVSNPLAGWESASPPFTPAGVQAGLLATTQIENLRF
jgi:hypothetical protein